MENKLYKLFALVLVIMLLTISATALFGCNTTSDEPSKPPIDLPRPTQPETPDPQPPQPVSSDPETDFADWLVGYKHASTYDGAYTVNKDERCAHVGEYSRVYRNTDFSSYEGNKYFSVGQTYYSDQDGNLKEEPDSASLLCIKTVDDNGTQRNKRIYIYANDSHATCEGSWVRPTEAKTAGHNKMLGQLSYLVDCDVDTVTAYEQALKAFYERIGGDGSECETKIKVTRYSDNSVELTANIRWTFYLDYYIKDNPDYILTERAYVFNFVVADGRMVEVDRTSVETHRYNTENKFSLTTVNESYRVEYTFYADAYESINMTTDVTQNEYTSLLNWVIGGYVHGTIVEPLVGAKYTAEQALKDFVEADILHKDFEDDSVSYESLFSLYADEAMTVPFTGFDAIEEFPSIYVKVTPPKDTAVVVCIYREYDGISPLVNMCLYKGGDTFSIGKFEFGSHLWYYQALSIDGVPLDPPSPTKFVVEAGKTYVVVVEN